MTTPVSLARTAALIGDPARAAMLVTLMDGRALTAGELAAAAGVTAQTASGHLAQLTQAGLLTVARQGRHRYHRLAGGEVAAMLEAMMALPAMLDAAADARPVRTGPRDAALRRARLCYDHLAGEVAVAIAQRMCDRGELELGADGGALTASGASFFSALGIAVDTGSVGFCRPCLDWSERRPHIGGGLGRALFARFEAQGWVRRGEGRHVVVTPPGLAALERQFGVRM